MLKVTTRLLLFLVLCQGVNAEQTAEEQSTETKTEETVYVHDMLRLGVRAVPDAKAGSIAVVSTGDALTVLGEQEGYLNIRTANGLEGWVSKGYISTTPPAHNLLPQLQKTLNQLQQAHEQLQKTHQALQQKYTTLQRQLTQSSADSQNAQPNTHSSEQLAQLHEENARLQQQLEQLKQAPPVQAALAPPPPANAAPTTGTLKQTLTMLLLVLLSIAAGFAYGVHWKARRVAERIGGLQI